MTPMASPLVAFRAAILDKASAHQTMLIQWLATICLRLGVHMGREFKYRRIRRSHPGVRHLHPGSSRGQSKRGFKVLDIFSPASSNGS
jgi:hypothetical protein